MDSGVYIVSESGLAEETRAEESGEQAAGKW